MLTVGALIVRIGFLLRVPLKVYKGSIIGICGIGALIIRIRFRVM